VVASTNAAGIACSDVIEFQNPCNNPMDSCHIYDLIADDVHCAEGQVFATINFEHNNTPSENFVVVANNANIGTYNYNQLPLQVHFTPGPNQNQVIRVLGANSTSNTYCSDVVEFPNPCSTNPIDSCQIYDLVVEEIHCVNGTVQAVIDFQYENTTTGSFVVLANNANVGVYNYSQLPVQISFPANGNTNQVVRVLGANSSVGNYCTDVVEFPNPCNVVVDTCDIYDLTATVSDCNSEGLFYVTLNFAHNNVSNLFDVRGNGQYYGTFGYNTLPIHLGPFAGNGTTNYEFIVRDHETESCHDVVEIGTVDCTSSTDDIPSEIGAVIVGQNNINLIVKSPINYLITNALGQILDYKEINNSTQINLYNFEKGLYVFAIQAKNSNKWFYKKLIVAN
nr:T9SS type A sorting domain-containing protein [Saprospiraceae bacterium]